MRCVSNQQSGRLRSRNFLVFRFLHLWFPDFFDEFFHKFGCVYATGVEPNWSKNRMIMRSDGDFYASMKAKKPLSLRRGATVPATEQMSNQMLVDLQKISDLSNC